MPTKPFDGAKLKIGRALKHAHDLKSEIDAYVSRDPAASFVQRDKHTGDYSVVLKLREGVPAQLPAIFGDTVHNLRTALDLLANDLVSLAGVTPKNVYFPFAESEIALEQAIKDRMKGAADDVLDIIRALKPYRGGNAVLRGLHDLDIMDKHKAVMKIGAGQGISPPMRKTVLQEKPFKILMEADWSALPTIPIDMTGFKVRPGVEIIGKVVGPQIGVFLASGLPLGGQSILAAVTKMGRLVQSIVQTFEAHCLGDPSP